MIGGFILKRFYHGSLWSRRIRHLMILFTFSINLFVNDIQNQLFTAGEQIVTTSDTLTRTFVATSKKVGNQISKKLETFQQSKHGWIIEYFNLPIPISVSDGLSKMSEYQMKLQNYGTLLGIASYLLSWVSFFFWIAITHSCLWLLYDLHIGQARVFVITILVFALTFNIYIYLWVYINFKNISSIF